MQGRKDRREGCVRRKEMGRGWVREERNGKGVGEGGKKWEGGG